MEITLVHILLAVGVWLVSGYIMAGYMRGYFYHEYENHDEYHMKMIRGLEIESYLFGPLALMTLLINPSFTRHGRLYPWMGARWTDTK